MGLIGKLIRGGGHRRSRLHDEKGHRVALPVLALNGPRALTGRLGAAFGRRPRLPWISFRAIAAIERSLTPTSQVAEFGSGMSTLWFARRYARVVSREDSREWHERVVAMIGAAGLTNVDLRFASDAEAYASLEPYPPAFFDLILIDGSHRGRCAASALSWAGRGALIYLDNSDKESEPGISPELGLRAAESELAAEVIRRGGSIEYFVDFAPAQCFVSQGMLCRLPS